MRQLFALRKLSLAVAGLVVTFHLWAEDGRKKPSDVPMTRPEELLASLDGIGSEAAFVELTDGSIMMSRGRGRFSVSKDGGLTWSPPQEARDADGNLLDGSDHNLIHLAGKGLGYVARPRTPLGGPPASYLVFYRSEDEGKTWQKPVRISEPSPFDEAAMNDVIVKTSSGRIILPVYAYLYSRSLTPSTTSCCFGLRQNQWISTGSHHTDPGFFWSYVYYSDDDGRSWKRSRSSEIYIWDPDAMTWSVAGEPTIVEVEPGKLLMLMRTMMGRLYKSWSFDNGETWSRAVSTALAASGAPAQVRKIPSTGDLLVVWTQHSAEEMRRGLVRARLSSAISRTNGALWEFFQNVESIVDGARVEAGPIRFVRPEGLMGASPLDPDPVRAPGEMVDIPASYTRCSYPSVFIYKDRVLIGHSNAYYDEKGEWKIPGRLKVLPLSWLYGGKENLKPTPELKKEYPLKVPDPVR